MSRTHHWVASVVIGTLLSIAVIAVSEPLQTSTPHVQSLSPISNTEKIVPMSRSECADLIAVLKAYASTPRGQHVLLSAYHGRANKITFLISKDCYTKLSTHTSSLVLPTALSGTSIHLELLSFLMILSPPDSVCRGEWKTMNLVVGPVTLDTVHVSVGMCWEGNTAWTQWGPDCQVTMLPGFGADVNWCGVWNGNFTTTPGANFDIYPWSNPLFKRYGYMRFYFYGDCTDSDV